MDGHKLRAGIINNEAIQIELARRKTEPPSKEIPKPTFQGGTSRKADYPQHYGWNPVYWSDYPKQPAWTVPMPKLAAPTVLTTLPDVPMLPCHYPPTEYMTLRSCPIWMPDVPKYVPHWNPYVDEQNTPFKEYLGPLTL